MFTTLNQSTTIHPDSQKDSKYFLLFDSERDAHIIYETKVLIKRQQSTSIDEFHCYLCLNNQESEKLIRPCKCKRKYVHDCCLKVELIQKHKLRALLKNKISCEGCKVPLNMNIRIQEFKSLAQFNRNPWKSKVCICSSFLLTLLMLTWLICTIAISGAKSIEVNAFIVILAVVVALTFLVSFGLFMHIISMERITSWRIEYPQVKHRVKKQTEQKGSVILIKQSIPRKLVIESSRPALNQFGGIESNQETDYQINRNDNNPRRP